MEDTRVLDLQCSAVCPATVIQELGHHHAQQDVVAVHDFINVLHQLSRNHRIVKEHLQVGSVKVNRREDDAVPHFIVW